MNPSPIRLTCTLLGILLVGCFCRASLAQDSDPPQDAPPAIDLAAAAAAFAEANEVFARDDSQLWGISLAGPLIFADVKTRMVVANQVDEEGLLNRQGDVFVGTLPQGKAIANTALHWGGVHWAMVMWPLPEDEFNRQALMAHESWHRVQDQLGFASSGADNSHMDSLQGRIWLQMEWRALAAALQADEDEAQRTAIRDALIFRAHRRSLFEAAAAAEREMEMHEGVAEYTGMKLAAKDDATAIGAAVAALKDKPGSLPTFVRSFAYVSGPAYGLLLDKYSESWRQDAADADFGELLAAATGVFRLPENLAAEAERNASGYAGEELILAENKRETERREQQAKFKQQFVDGVVVRIPLRQMRMSFNPNNITPFEEHGTVYGTITVSDVWGELTAEEGCLVAKDWRMVTVAAGDSPQAGMTSGPGWKLKLKPGWAIKQDLEQEGSFVLGEEQVR